MGDYLLSKVLRVQPQFLNVIDQVLRTLSVARIPAIEVENSSDSFVLERDFSFELVGPHEDDPRKLRIEL